MKLVNLLSALDSAQVLAAPDVTVTGITADPHEVKPGDLFVSIPGAQVDGTSSSPMPSGAGRSPWSPSASVRRRDGIGAAVVPDARRALSALADRFYDYPSCTLKMVGITGTNGKTTTAFLVEAIARAAGRTMGVMGARHDAGRGAAGGQGGLHHPRAAHDSPAAGRDAAARARGAVLEVSSHALEQRRTDHCRFDVAVFTNLTHEHLDYHGDMEGYYAAKARLFRQLRPGVYRRGQHR